MTTTTDGAAAPSSEMRVAVEARALTKTYEDHGEDVLALNDVDLEVGQGEFIAVMGPSGSGKSTLLHLLGALDAPTSGEVFIAGRSLATLSRSQLAALRRDEIGFVFQLFNLIPSLTVSENIALPSIAAGERPPVYRERLQEMLDLTGLAGKADRYPSQISGGEQQRVAVARALVRQPAVLLADEPTGNLDTRTGDALLELFSACNKFGQTIVLVTHDPKVASAADRVLFMRDGAFVEEAPLRTRDASIAELVRVEEPPVRRSG
jgi:putative ABC transport system ATP-binding protein